MGFAKERVQQFVVVFDLELVHKGGHFIYAFKGHAPEFFDEGA
jgi:hypothetical protein